MHDTCGVNNLHGIPGILGGIIGAFSAGLASSNVYGDNLDVIFTEFKNGRTQAGQALCQLAALGSSIGIALITGLLTGCLLRCGFFHPLTAEECFEDEVSWQMEIEEEVLDKKLIRHNIAE